jgi:hypothetical protein
MSEPLRVVIGEDDVVLREGIARPLCELAAMHASTPHRVIARSTVYAIRQEGGAAAGPPR